MYKLFVSAWAATLFAGILGAEDISDTRTSAVEAVRQCRAVLSDAKGALSQISVQGAGAVLESMANRIQQNIGTQPVISGSSPSPQPTVVPLTPADQKLQKEVQEKVTSNLQSLQQKSSSLNISNDKMSGMDQIKSQIAESLNSTGTVGSGVNQSNKN